MINNKIFPNEKLFVIAGGSLAATFDLIFAFTYYGQFGVTPIRILQSISSGFLGTAAREGGIPTAILGTFLHFAIAIAAAFIFYFSAKKFNWLVKHAFISGCVFGFGMFLAMNFIVLPLSAFPHAVKFSTQSFLIISSVHMFLVGQPIAWMVRKGLINSKPSST